MGAMPPPYPAFADSDRIAIVGCGVMGTKVGWACARKGIQVTLFDVDAARAEAARRTIIGWSPETDAVVAVAASLAEALAEVRLAFENVPEDLALKTKVLRDIGRKMAPDAYIGSNTSSLLCSPLARASLRPDRLFNMNFSDPRQSRMVELMGSPLTVPETLAYARAWAKAIGMIVIESAKEQVGYSHNRLWRVIKKETLRQIAEGIATPEMIDRAWMLSFGQDIGPCGIMDDVGLATVLAIENAYFADSGDPADRPPAFLREMVAGGRLGVQSGEGFYRYPDPAYTRTDFLEG